MFGSACCCESVFSTMNIAKKWVSLLYNRWTPSPLSSSHCYFLGPRFLELAKNITCNFSIILIKHNIKQRFIFFHFIFKSRIQVLLLNEKVSCGCNSIHVWWIHLHLCCSVLCIITAWFQAIFYLWFNAMYWFANSQTVGMTAW